VRSSVAFALSLALGTALTPLAGRLARRYGLLDHALSSRKVHGRPVPRTGGVAIVLAFSLPIILTGAGVLAGAGVGGAWGLTHDARRQILGLLLGGAVIAALGVYDDLRGAGARLKLAAQFTAAGLAYAFGYRIDGVSLPFLDHLTLGWLGLPLTLVWIAGVVNAVNLVDGLDGLAAGVGLLAALATAFIAGQAGHLLTVLTMAALGGATLAFLFFNFHRASIFMGDTGSMFLGFVLATASVRAHQRPGGAVALLVPVVILGLPVADTLLAIARRAARGVPLFAADREHLHHKLLDLGLSPRGAVLVLWGAAGLFGAVAVGLTRAGPWRAMAYLACLVALALVASWRLGYLTRERLRALATARRRNLELQSGVREIRDRLRRAAEPIEIWRSVKEAAPRLGARALALRLVREEETLDFRRKVDPPAANLRTRHSLRAERVHGGFLELAWDDDRECIDRDTEIAVERLCSYVMRAVGRLDTGAIIAANEEQVAGARRRQAHPWSDGEPDSSSSPLEQRRRV
jgi:UDP-GlcNAc:undecaprenyl-phosphate GlcNAc-1-phosphate transferase